MAAISFVTNKRSAAMLLPRSTAIARFRLADFHGATRAVRFARRARPDPVAISATALLY